LDGKTINSDTGNHPLKNMVFNQAKYARNRASGWITDE
jgi:hypothetical protein